MSETREGLLSKIFGCKFWLQILFPNDTAFRALVWRQWNPRLGCRSDSEPALNSLIRIAFGSDRRIKVNDTEPDNERCKNEPGHRAGSVIGFVGKREYEFYCRSMIRHYRFSILQFVHWAGTNCTLFDALVSFAWSSPLAAREHLAPKSGPKCPTCSPSG